MTTFKRIHQTVKPDKVVDDAGKRDIQLYTHMLVTIFTDDADK